MSKFNLLIYQLTLSIEINKIMDSSILIKNNQIMNELKSIKFY